MAFGRNVSMKRLSCSINFSPASERNCCKIDGLDGAALAIAPSKFGAFLTLLDGPKECVAMDIPHELRDEFPQEISLIERMIRTNYEFRRLAERYDEVNRNIYRIESGEEPTTDEVLARLKKWRLKLKDEIAAILTKLENRM
jgi:uncharacterized protein YdcH (DUF465 family)